MMKKILSVVLVGCMVLSFMACGAKEESTEDSSAATEITQNAENEPESTEVLTEQVEDSTEEETVTEEQSEVNEDTNPYADKVYVGTYQGRTLIIKAVNSEGNPLVITIDDEEYEVNENGEFFMEEGNSGCLLSSEAERDESGLITKLDIKFAFGDTYILSNETSGE